MDWSVQKADIGSTKKFKFRLKWEVYDAYGHLNSFLSDVSNKWWGTVKDATCSATETKYFHLPQEYYKVFPQTLNATHWGDYNEDDSGNPQRFGELLKIPGPIADALKSGTVSRIDVYPSFMKSVDGTFTTMTFKVYEIGLFATKFVDTIQGDLYGQITGETTGAVPSNTVYGAFKLILETYDGIPTAQIDYGNLPSVRGDWPVSRQILEKKNSLDYLTELAEQSFTCIVPTRTGTRKLTAWRDDETLVATHTEVTIIRDSITSFVKTDLKDAFDDFTLYYQYNAATRKYERTLCVKHVDADSFPASSDEAWKDYVPGVNPDSYVDAQSIWADCHKTYRRAKQTLTAPDSLSNLNWYADTATTTSGVASPGASVDDSPWKYLKELSQWSTLQKEIVTYRLPMSYANLVLELLNYVKFSDAIFTSNTLRPGWITYIEVDTVQDQIILEVTLNPPSLAFDQVIIERGKYMNTDTVTEDIVQPDTFSEPQQISYT